MIIAQWYIFVSTHCLPSFTFLSFIHSFFFHSHARTCILALFCSHSFNVITSSQFQLISFFFIVTIDLRLLHAFFPWYKTHSTFSLSLSLPFLVLTLSRYKINRWNNRRTDDSVSKEDLQINCLNNNNLNININAICLVNFYNRRHWTSTLSLFLILSFFLLRWAQRQCRFLSVASVRLSLI